MLEAWSLNEHSRHLLKTSKGYSWISIFRVAAAVFVSQATSAKESLGGGGERVPEQSEIAVGWQQLRHVFEWKPTKNYKEIN